MLPGQIKSTAKTPHYSLHRWLRHKAAGPGCLPPGQDAVLSRWRGEEERLRPALVSTAHVVHPPPPICLTHKRQGRLLLSPAPTKPVAFRASLCRLLHSAWHHIALLQQGPLGIHSFTDPNLHHPGDPVLGCSMAGIGSPQDTVSLGACGLAVERRAQGPVCKATQESPG